MFIWKCASPGPLDHCLVRGRLVHLAHHGELPTVLLARPVVHLGQPGQGKSAQVTVERSRGLRPIDDPDRHLGVVHGQIVGRALLMWGQSGQDVLQHRESRRAAHRLCHRGDAVWLLSLNRFSLSQIQRYLSWVNSTVPIPCASLFLRRPNCVITRRSHIDLGSFGVSPSARSATFLLGYSGTQSSTGVGISVGVSDWLCSSAE